MRLEGFSYPRVPRKFEGQITTENWKRQNDRQPLHLVPVGYAEVEAPRSDKMREKVHTRSWWPREDTNGQPEVRLGEQRGRHEPVEEAERQVLSVAQPEEPS